MKKRTLGMSLVLAGLALLWLTAPPVAAGAPGAADQNLVGRPVAAPAARPQVMKPPPPLTAAWWQTFLSVPGAGDPFDRCDLGKPGVVFFAGTAGGTATRSCTVPAGKLILVPLINIECSTAEGNGDTPAELRACAAGFADQFTGLKLSIDTFVLRDPFDFRVRTGLFKFTAAEGNVFGVPAGTTRSVADGYWALIAPLPPGAHTVSFGGSYPPGSFTTFATYNLTVTS
jgi:hypothetical protein